MHDAEYCAIPNIATTKRQIEQTNFTSLMVAVSIHVIN
jgi:hypothetical protein